MQLCQLHSEQLHINRWRNSVAAELLDEQMV